MEGSETSINNITVLLKKFKTIYQRPRFIQVFLEWSKLHTHILYKTNILCYYDTTKLLVYNNDCN